MYQINGNTVSVGAVIDNSYGQYSPEQIMAAINEEDRSFRTFSDDLNKEADFWTYEEPERYFEEYRIAHEGDPVGMHWQAGQTILYELIDDLNYLASDAPIYFGSHPDYPECFGWWERDPRD